MFKVFRRAQDIFDGRKMNTIYYIHIIEEINGHTNDYYYDESFSRIVGISFDEYEKIMREEFNGTNRYEDDHTIFHDKEIAGKVVEWIKSAIVMKELVGK